MAPEDKNEISREVNSARPGSPHCASTPPFPCSYAVVFIMIIIINIIIIIRIHNSERIKTSKDVVFPSTCLVTFVFHSLKMFILDSWALSPVGFLLCIHLLQIVLVVDICSVILKAELNTTCLLNALLFWWYMSRPVAFKMATSHALYIFTSSLLSAPHDWWCFRTCSISTAWFS